MKPQELCYGNLVSYLGRTHVIESPNATKSWASPILKNGTLGAVELLDNDKIEPLPVTAENLAMVGFELKEEMQFYFIYTNHKDAIVTVNKVYEEVFIYCDTGNHLIFSISQMQNILQSVHKVTIQYNAPTV